MLKQGSGVEDHLVFLLDICLRSILTNLSPGVVSPPERILRADSHAYKPKYTKVPEQVVDRHRMLKTLPDIMGIPDVALDEYEVGMNKWDDELKDFMRLTEKKYRVYKDDQIEWSLL